MHAGRKTNLDAVAVLTGCGKRNLSLTLDADGLQGTSRFLAQGGGGGGGGRFFTNDMIFQFS